MRFGFKLLGMLQTYRGFLRHSLRLHLGLLQGFKALGCCLVVVVVVIVVVVVVVAVRPLYSPHSPKQEPKPTEVKARLWICAAELLDLRRNQPKKPLKKGCIGVPLTVPFKGSFRITRLVGPAPNGLGFRGFRGFGCRV